jgi:myo-inositol-1-phosphate synthase
MISHKYDYKYVDIINSDTYNITEDSICINTKPLNDKKLGVMLVGIGGNNGSTFLSSMLAHQKGIKWENKNGIHSVDFFGSLYQYGTCNIGFKDNKPYTKLFREITDFKSPNNLIISGWDINSDNIYEACKKNKVLDTDLLKQLKNDLEKITPLESVYYENFIATNQKERATNIKKNKNKWDDFLYVKSDIQSFKIKNNLEKVVVMWTASTERFSKGTWKTIEELFLAIKNNDPEISPSIIFAAAAIFEGCIFINGSPQNTISESILSLAKKHNTFVAGEDFKTGQTKLKSVLVDFLASSGIKPLSIVSYNHLGNNDGYNLKEQPQFESKEITKRNVIDDIVDENKVLFNNKKPEHCVVIKYIEAVGDSKRAMDEYYSELFLDGRSTISIHNICEDTLLAVPLMLDIILFAEFFSRISFTLKDKTTVPFGSNLSLLSLFFKAPVDDNNPIINSFFKQRYAIENFIKASKGFPINDFININNRI